MQGQVASSSRRSILLGDAILGGDSGGRWNFLLVKREPATSSEACTTQTAGLSGRVRTSPKYDSLFSTRTGVAAIHRLWRTPDRMNRSVGENDAKALCSTRRLIYNGAGIHRALAELSGVEEDDMYLPGLFLNKVSMVRRSCQK